MTRPDIVLASASPFRRKLLEDAGVQFRVERPAIDERAVEQTLAGTGSTPEDVAMVLAEAKAGEVSQRFPETCVIGSDQTLSLEDRIFHKPADMEGARKHLLALSGRTHRLNTAAVIVRNGETLWRKVDIAELTMRPLDPAFIGRHLARVGDRALSSVGAYQIEGEGIQLFDRIEGSHFTIVGLPMLPLLAALRELDLIDG